jgi:polyketide synthase PksL
MNVGFKIRQNAKSFPDKEAIVFLQGFGKQISKLTYKELDVKASLLASVLHQNNLYKKRVILLFHTGIDFIIAYTACLYAGVIAVPYSLKEKAKILNQSTILTTEQIKSSLNITANYIITQPESTELFYNENILSDDLTHIQYSSGTTGHAKGVSVSQNNLFYSLKKNSRFWRLKHTDIALTCTPHHNTYGLITGILLPLFNGNTNYVIPVEDFVMSPAWWLKAISTYQVTYSGCPNFGYQRCIDTTEDTPLDLSQWKIAICGGENIRASTLSQFAQRYFSVGFKPESFCTSYGMSELTGFITSTSPHYSPTIHNNNVSNGWVTKNIKIIDPNTLRQLDDEHIGEIIVKGKTLTRGYIEIEHNNNERFNQEYFRTGDIGYIYRNELYLKGRINDVVIINGKNHYLQDIEASAKVTSLSNLAFAINNKIIILQEVSDDKRIDWMIQKIVNKVVIDHQLTIHEIMFVSTGSLPKTANGKLQRVIARDAYINKQLPMISHKIIPDINEIFNQIDIKEKIQSVTDADQKVMLLKSCISLLLRRLLGIDDERTLLDTDNFFDLGMNSLSAAEFHSLFGKTFSLSKEFPLVNIFQHATINELALHLSRILP